MTRPLRALVLVVALAVAALLGACGDQVSPYAAKVNGVAIKQRALDDELDAIRTNEGYVAFLDQQGNTVTGKGQGTFDAGFVRRVLTRQIYLDLVHQEFLRRKLSVSAQDKALVEADVRQQVGGPSVYAKFPTSYRDTLTRRAAEVAKLQLALSNTKVDEAAMKDFYDKNPALFAETCVSHILFAVLDANGQVDTAATEAKDGELVAQAKAAKAQLDGGADFATLAKQLSQDKSNADQGGDLQCGTSGRFVPEFENAMDTLQPGQVSDPVKTQFGEHLIKVTKRDTKPFNEVRDEIQQRLLSNASAGFSDFLSTALVKAKISINPRFGTFSKGGQSPGIVPPATPTTEDTGGASSQSNNQQQQTLNLGG